MSEIQSPRVKKVRLHVAHKSLDLDCNECGFAALIQITAIELRDTGVNTWFDKTICGRCEDMRAKR